MLLGAGVSGVSEEGSDTSGGGGGGGRGQGECSSQCEDAAGRTPLSLRTRWGEKGEEGKHRWVSVLFLKSNDFSLTFSNTEKLPNFLDITSVH